MKETWGMTFPCQVDLHNSSEVSTIEFYLATLQKYPPSNFMTLTNPMLAETVLCICVCVLSCVQLFETPWTVACQAPLTMGFPRQEYWSWLPFPSPVDLPNPKIEPVSLVSPALASRFFTTSTTQEASRQLYFNTNKQEVTAYILLENVLIRKS